MLGFQEGTFIDELMRDPQIAAALVGRMTSGAPQEPGAPRLLSGIRPAEPRLGPEPTPLPPGTMPPIEQLPLGPPEPEMSDSLARTFDSMQPPPPTPPMPREMATPDGNILQVGDSPANRMVRPPEPTFGERMKAAIPRMIAAGIAGAATPSKYGGGALDIFQGLQAGQGELERRDLMAYQQGRQRSQDDLTRREKESQIHSHDASARAQDAHADYFKAQTGAKQTPNMEAILTEAWNKETDPAKKQAIYEQLLQIKGHPQKQFRPLQIKDAKGNYVGIYDPNTGEFEQANDPAAEQKKRVNDVRMMMGLPQDQTLWPDWAVLSKATPEMKAYIVTGQMKPWNERSSNPTAASLAADAARGVPGAAEALAMLQRGKPKQSDPLAEEMRQARLDKMRADQFDSIDHTKTSTLQKARQFEESALAQLDKNPGMSAVDKAGKSAAIREEAKRMRQDAYTAYTAAVRRHGGTAEDWVVMEDGSVIDQRALAASGGTPKPPAPPAGGPGGAGSLTPGAASYMQKRFGAGTGTRQ